MATVIITAIVVLWCLAMIPAVLAPFFTNRPKQGGNAQASPSTLQFRAAASPAPERLCEHRSDSAAA